MSLPGWFAWGRPSWLGVSAVVPVTALALSVWSVWLAPDVSDLVAVVASVPLGALILGGLWFSICNAVLEEAVFRGIVQTGLSRLLGPTAAVILQALAFGCIHVHGFPRGALGVAMASVYGLMLGLLRRHSGGLLAPVLAHIAADLTIVVLLATQFSS